MRPNGYCVGLPSAEGHGCSLDPTREATGSSDAFSDRHGEAERRRSVRLAGRCAGADRRSSTSRLEQRRRWDRGCPLHHPGWSHLNTSEGSRLRCRQCFPPIIELTGASVVLMRNFVTDVTTSVADSQFPSLTRHEFRLCAAIVRLWSTVHPRCRSPRLINSIQDCERSCERSYARALGRDSPYRVCLRLYDVNEQPLHASAQFEVGATRPHTLRPRPHQSLDRTAPEGVMCNC